MKQVTKTDAVKALIAKGTGDEGLNPDDVAVYEAIFANTLPLRRIGGIFQGAEIGADMLAAMASRLDAGETIPLQTMHQDGLPKGRVISAKMQAGPNGSSELRGMFYVPKANNDGLMTKLDTGVINEVSIGALSAMMLCSACGFDFMGEEASFENLWDCTCSNGHKVGKDGIRVRLHGLKAWNELSLVGRGAVGGAKILPKSQHSAAALMLRASVSDALEPEIISPETSDMDVAALLTASATDKADLIVAKRDVADMTTKLTAADTEIASLKTQLASSATALAAAQATDAANLKADHDAAVALLDEITTASLAATGRAAEKLPETVSDRIKLFTELRAKLAATIPVGGRSAAASGTNPGGQAEAEKTAADYAAFKSSR